MKDIQIKHNRQNEELYQGKVQNIIERDQTPPANSKYLPYFENNNFKIAKNRYKNIFGFFCLLAVFLAGQTRFRLITNSKRLNIALAIGRAVLIAKKVAIDLLE